MEVNFVNMLISIFYVSLICFLVIKTNQIEKHVKPKTIALSIFSSIIFIYITSYSSETVIEIVAIFLISMFINSIVFRIKIIKGLVFSIIFITFYCLCDAMTHLIFIKLLGISINNISSSELIYCLYKLMSFVMISLLLNMDRSVAVYYIYNKSLDFKAKFASAILLIILMLLILVNLFIIRKIDDSSLTYILSVGSFGASTLLCMSLFYFINIIVDTTNNLDITKDYNNKLELYNKTMQELISIQRRTVHEFNNKLTVLNGYIADKKYDDASIFISKSLKETKNLDSSLFKNIKNSGLKSLLLFKYAEIKDKNIGFELMVNKRIENLIVDSDDVCKILGIFIDNAIEAAASSRNPFISIGIVKVEEVINITIMNSIPDEHLSVNKNSLKTRSEEINIEKMYSEGYSKKGYNRGFGLSIARDLINRYKELNCITEIRDGFFIQDLNISKQ